MSATVPLIPDSAPFSPEQRAWLNGFLAGLFSRGPAPVGLAAPAAVAPALQPLTILFGSQTGTCEGLAKKAAKEAGKRGFAPTVLDMAQTDATKLAGETPVLVLVSTYGDGEPPDSARALHAALAADTAPALAGLRYSVCALGDRNYAQFCRCGADFDALLEKRGATRLTPRVECDVDYDEAFATWLHAVLVVLSAAPAGAVAGPAADLAARSPAAPALASADHADDAAESGYSKKKPFPAPVLAVRRLSAAASAKEVNHVEFSLEGSGLSYEAGDALGVMPQNCPELVGAVLVALGCDGEEAVPAPDGGAMSLRQALTVTYDLGKPTPEFASQFAPGVLAGAMTAAAGTTVPLHVLDCLLARTDVRLPPADFVRLLRKLQPRLYSISSSPRAHLGQVHLTVGAVRYDAHGRPRKGVCSTFLAERALAGGKAGVFVHANQAFRPPPKGDTPMIMIGPGTGIAPFRAFLAERRVTGATGKNWLFFGDQREAHDFLYGDELLAFHADGFLTRLDLAWSRDQTAKIYVQTRMLEAAAELWAWLEAGAHVYVCGDASRMAKDVDAALHTVIHTAGGRTTEQAATYVQALKTSRRYQRDVY